MNDHHIVKVADNVLPPEVAEQCYESLQHQEWLRQSQSKPDHYCEEHYFGGDERLPKPDEVYTAAFSYCVTGDLEEAVTLKHIMPVVAMATDRGFEKVRLNGYKLDHFDHMRAHYDTYIGPCAFVLYLCREWRIDWGGLWISPDFGIVIPKFNRLLVVYGKVPHMVTMVEPHARCPRYSLNGFPR